MAAYKSPGLLLILDDKIYYKEMGTLAEAKKAIDDFKEDLLSQGYTEIHNADQFTLTTPEGSDIKALLTAGVTMKILGK